MYLDLETFSIKTEEDFNEFFESHNEDSFDFIDSPEAIVGSIPCTVFVVSGDRNEVMMEDMYYDNYRSCPDCGDIYPIDDMYWCLIADGDYLVCNECVDHYYYCECCGEYVENATQIYHSGYAVGYACDNCLNSGDYYYCEDCGHYDDTVDDDGWCDCCRPDSLIHDYHSYDDDDFKSTFCDDEDRSKILHMGFELEVENYSGYLDSIHVERVNEYLNGYTCYEEDGSLTDGFEIISRPASLTYHKSMYQRMKYALDYLKHNNFRSHNGGHCGLHIHLDRAYFGSGDKLAEIKLFYIFNKYWNEIVKFSRRKEFYYCKKNRIGSGETYSLKDVYYRYKPELRDASKSSLEIGNAKSGHYVAINCGNSDTIELRIFRGTLRFETFDATLRFASRLAFIAKNIQSAKLTKMTWEEILGDDPVILAYWETVKDRT